MSEVPCSRVFFSIMQGRRERARTRVPVELREVAVTNDANPIDITVPRGLDGSESVDLGAPAEAADVEAGLFDAPLGYRCS
jgi:hypothetical protein